MITVTASAPGKFVVLGEHAVVYGKPAIALAMDMRFSMQAHFSKEFRVNNAPANSFNVSPHMRYISELHGDDPLSIYIGDRVPSGSGLGSSAALSVAYSAALRKLKGLPTDPATIAKEAYEAEYFAQGRGSPMDTSASTNGGGIALNIPYKQEDFLWRIEKGDRAWDVSRVHVPKMTFVIGNTGIRAPTGPLVEKVRKYRDSNTFAAEIVDEIANITLEGMERMKQDDRVGLGSLMTKNHKLLSILGVSCPQLNKLVECSLPYSYGAKLTGSGGGGCMIALTDHPDKVARAITLHGGTPYIVNTGVPGVQVDVKKTK
ncbi:MAG: mevalonate kinase [Candidatus Methanomethylophilus sp.]|nr:mevalonate kinase [Methanomethylophilus sp.]MBQ2486189.1 mevalonate kinase [Methanomethylophilus sp.]MBQ4368414.1 mevalonate kinase [Methanomethylophilus sp.]MBQ4411671.1 mevalonate kinase [Methanomethylophilus sp.]MBQ5397306.1 mevalonate kinase [Methanomethylophilus sp.]